MDRKETENAAEKALICADCGEEIEDPDDAETLDDGRVVCYSCFSAYEHCYSCGEQMLSEELVWWGEVRLCRDCLSNESGVDISDGPVEEVPPPEDFLDRWIGEIAYGIAGLIHVFDPQLVLIGGGVSAQDKLLIQPLKEKVLSMIMPDFADDLEFRPAALGNDAGLIGAVYYLMSRENTARRQH